VPHAAAPPATPDNQLTSDPEVHCPACGVRVTPGYVKCPKCHAALPNAVAQPRRRASRQTMDPGGTSVSGGAGTTLYALVAGGVALAVIVVIALTRGGDGDDATGDDEAAADEVGLEVDDVAAGPPAEPIGPAAATFDEPEVTRASVIRALSTRLQTNRLWARVEVDPADEATLAVRSAACSDAGMRPTLMASATELRAVEFTAVRCYAQHGELIFEDGL
jgi:hypothetical protein